MATPRLIFLLVLLFQAILFASDTSSISAPVSITVSATPIINLYSFNASPLIAPSGSALLFTVNMSNSGNTEANVTLNVTAYDPLNLTAGNFAFNQITIFAGENQTVSRAEIISYPPNDYRAAITGVYSAKITNVLEANFTITSSAPSAPPAETLRDLTLSVEGECTASLTRISVKNSAGLGVRSNLAVEFQATEGWNKVVEGYSDMLTFVSNKSGIYRASATTGGYYPASKEFVVLECAIQPTIPPTPPAPPGIIAVGTLQISNQSILKTAVLGERIPLIITIENPLNTSALVNINFSGVPREWVEYAEKAMLEAGEKRNVILWVTVPENASAADYFIAVNTTYNNASVTSPIALKVRETPSIPFVAREVYADYGENKTEVVLTLKNPTNRRIGYMQIQERIDKSVAPDISYLHFTTPPTKILEADPLVQWDFENVLPGEQREVSYGVTGIVKEFSALVKVPVEQINIISVEEPEKLRITRQYPAQQFSGEIFTINVTFTNLRSLFEKVFVTLELPEGWAVTPQNVTVAIPSRTQTSTTFWVRPPYNMPSDTYYGVVRAQYGNITIEDVLQFNVEQNPGISPGITLETVLYFLVLMAIVTAVFFMLGGNMGKKKRKI
jgi:hypothetical protein